MISYKLLLKLFTWLNLVLLTLFFLTGCGEQKSSNIATESSLVSKNPNIFLIILDDQVTSGYGFMENLRKYIIEQGTTFTNTISASSVCCPARASLMSGMYVHNTQEYTNKSAQFVGTIDKMQSIGLLMNDLGYSTSYFGKYKHGYNDVSYVPPGWDYWLGFRGGYVPYYNSIYSDNGDKKTIPEGEYSTDFISGKVIDYLSKQTSHSKPIFSVISFNAPHMPDTPAQRHVNSFPKMQFSAPLPETDVTDKSQWVLTDVSINGPVIEECDLWTLGTKEVKSFCDVSKNRILTLLAVDEFLKLFFNTLEKHDLLKNSYIFLVADHNDDYSRRIRNSTGKLLPYKEGILTPLFVSGPNIPLALNRSHIVSHVDLYPTFADLGGADMSYLHDYDGRSLVPLFDPYTQVIWRTSVLSEVGQFGEWWRKPIPPAFKLLRTEDFKYIRFTDGSEELYDLRLDPDESKNIFNNIGNEAKNQFRESLEALNSCKGNSCRTSDSPDFSNVYN